MDRNLETIIARVREEIRAEGADGAGISDFLLESAVNSALADLSEIFTIRAHIEFDIEEDENGEPKRAYSLRDVTGTETELENIIRVTYGDRVLDYISLDEYLAIDKNDEGELRSYTLWGNKMFLVGGFDLEYYEKVGMYIVRGPSRLQSKDDVPETPYYADEAIMHFAIAAAYRETRDYDRANYHYGIYLRNKDSLLKRAVPQMQREKQPHMRDSYWGVTEERTGISRTSDTNPGGRGD